MTHKRLHMLSLLVVGAILVGCATSRTPQMSPTPAPTDTPELTPTSIFTDLDLEPMLSEPGDYLKDTKLLRFNDAPPTWYRSLPAAERVVHVDWETYHPGSPGGGVTIFLHGSPEDVEAGWSATVDLLKLGGETYELPDIGEGAVGQEPSTLAFVRCRAIVIMNLGHADPEALSPYAEFLDDELQPIVCK